MAINPSIFISATSSDLASARDLVAKILTSMGYTPIWQDIAATDAGKLLDVLRARMDPCSAMIQLVGTRFGAAPPDPDPQFGRVSYTQYEAFYFEWVHKPVTYIFLNEDFPTDPCIPEPPDLKALQTAYRQSLKDRGVLRYPASSDLELENRILRIRDELAVIRQQLERGRRRMQIVGAFCLFLLLAISWGVWRLRTASTQQSHVLSNIQQAQTNQISSISTLTQTTEKQGDVVAHIDSSVQEILALPASAREDRLADSLASARADDLVLLSRAGTSSFQIQTALAQNVAGGEISVGYSFFDNSRDNPAAIEWFKAALKAGVDPNLLLPDKYWEFRSLLNNALLAGNASAALALLDAGATPHQYQNVHMKIIESPTFIFPYEALLDNDRLSVADKHKIADAFRRCGAVFYSDPPPADQRASLEFEYHEITEKAEQQLGFKLENSPTISEQPNSWLIQVAKARGQTDWVNFIQSMPKDVTFDGRPDSGVRPFKIRYFLGIYKDNAYFLATSYNNAHYLIKVSRDQTSWTLYSYQGEQAGKGFILDRNGNELKYGNGGDYAKGWLAWDLEYDSVKKEIVVDDYDHFKVISFQNGK